MNDVIASSIFHLTNHEIYVLTAADQGQVSGQVATWMMLTTLVPDQMRIVASISPTNFTHQLIQQSHWFVVNLLAEDQYEWVARFGLHSSRERDKFADMTLQYTGHGIPILPGTCGWAECRVGQQIDLGDRTLYIADLIEQQVVPGRQPLRKLTAFAKLPPEILQALTDKRDRDAERDRTLIKPLF